MSIEKFSQIQAIEGLQIIPVDGNKVPLAKDWQKTKTIYDLSKFQKLGGIGLATGSISGNIEVIDIDQKYSLDGKLFESYKSLIAKTSKSLLSKLVVNRTRSGGYHFIYRCPLIEGNVKLARRFTTSEEMAANPHDKVRVLIETRGEGGQIVIPPTDGYEIVYGSLSDIKTITEEERDILFSCARQLNEYVILEPNTPRELKQQPTGGAGLSPGDDYNERGDVLQLLESHGWSIVGRSGQKTLLKRPGDSHAATSGNYDNEFGWFSVFTTSTIFEPEKAYRPWHVYTWLECNGDYAEAARKLSAMGYGEVKKEPSEPSVKTSYTKLEGRTPIDTETLSFLAKEDDIDRYFDSVVKGTFKKGLTTGFPKLDEYFVFKQGNLVIVNGHANVGKTVVLWYLAMLTAIQHKWKWVMLCSENSAGGMRTKMVEFYWNCQIKQLSPEQRKEAYDFVKEHFFIIDNTESYNYEQVLQMFSAVHAKHNVQSVLIDTYNSLDVPAKDAYQYHYSALNSFRYWAKANKVSVYVNAHPGTGAMRAKDPDGFPMAPLMADTEQGSMFAAKADDFLTIHRKPNHEVDWRKTEIHVRKIKEVETGGRPSPFREPFVFEMHDGCGFATPDGFNPIAKMRVMASAPKEESKSVLFNKSGFDFDEAPF